MAKLFRNLKTDYRYIGTVRVQYNLRDFVKGGCTVSAPLQTKSRIRITETIWIQILLIVLLICYWNETLVVNLDLHNFFSKFRAISVSVILTWQNFADFSGNFYAASWA